MLSAIFSILGKLPKTVYWVAACIFLLLATTCHYHNRGYNKGYAEAEERYISKINKIEADSQSLRAELEKKNSEIIQNVIIEYIDRERIIYKNKIVYRDVIKEVLMPAQCPMTNGWVEVHDAAATQTVPIIGDNYDQNSNYNDIDALMVVVDNYTTCHQIRNQLIALQDWVRLNDQTINGDK
jgi:hypothetical protein